MVKSKLKMRPFFSIIIPVYNVAPYLRECLDSVFSQTYTDWEAICVDDGSTDGSGVIIDEYAAKDNRFKVIHQKNAGVSAARNAALDVSKGEWVDFLDADDVLAPQTLLTCKQVIEKNDGLDYVSFRSYTFDGYDQCILNDYTANALVRDVSREIDAELIEAQFGGGVYKASIIGSIRFDKELAIGEDKLFFGKVLSNIRKTCSLDSYFYGYRQRLGSAMHNGIGQKFVIDGLKCWTRRLELLFNEKRVISKSSVRLFLQFVTEYFAENFVSLPKVDRDKVWNEWICNIEKLYVYRKRMPLWYKLVITIIKTHHSYFWFYTLCYMPRWMKLMGIHR